MSYAWPDPPVFRPGMTLALDDDSHVVTEDVEARDGNNFSENLKKHSDQGYLNKPSSNHTTLNEDDGQFSYNVLKSDTYQLKRKHHYLSCTNVDLKANEQSTLVEQPDISTIDTAFILPLNQQLQKISLFYKEKEKELFDDL
ncbi:hypothetical protein HD554DRAFT_2328727 [Boletus coccyginus]|nr:hypothetical protein HD554DRAFT_2328727 [Boletus coccyginus]